MSFISWLFIYSWRNNESFMILDRCAWIFPYLYPEHLSLSIISHFTKIYPINGFFSSFKFKFRWHFFLELFTKDTWVELGISWYQWIYLCHCTYFLYFLFSSFLTLWINSRQRYFHIRVFSIKYKAWHQIRHTINV